MSVSVQMRHGATMASRNGRAEPIPFTINDAGHVPPQRILITELIQVRMHGDICRYQLALDDLVHDDSKCKAVRSRASLPPLEHLRCQVWQIIVPAICK